MIRIRFDEPTTHIWKRWIRDCETDAKQLKGAFSWGAPFEVADVYRRKSVKQEVFLAKGGPFKGRCAYCEANIADFQHGDIEHYRPKKGVTDENDVPVSVVCPDGVTRPHPGYFWLAYDWRNLLASCTKCNQPGENGVGKRNRFPVRSGANAVTEATLALEQPLLINPADPNDADPEDHLSVDVETGVMVHHSDRGKMCIDVFGLNVRDTLTPERKSAMEEVKAKLVTILIAEAAAASKALKELEDMQKGSHNYTLSRRVQYNNLKERTGWN